MRMAEKFGMERVKQRDFTWDVIPDGKTEHTAQFWQANSAGLRTVISRRLSHTVLRSSLRESHSFLTLPADTTMASSQGTQHPFLAIHSADEHHMIYSFSNTTSYSTFYALRFCSDHIMTDVASKQQTTALFLSTIITRTRRHTELA
jgi:hypothetical protein